MASKIYQQLRAARKRAGLTQVKMAEILDVTQPHVSAIEKGSSDTGLAKAEMWALATGHHIVVVNHETELLAAELSVLGDKDAELVLRLVDLLPHLSEDNRDVLTALFDAWSATHRPKLQN